MQKKRSNDDSILIVDDEATLLETLCEFFTSRGFTVFGAENVGEALTIYEREKPALIITDVRMPMANGTELIELLNQDILARPIIFCASGHSDFTPATSYEMGIDLFFSKPFDLGELHAAANHYLKVHSRVRNLYKKIGANNIKSAHNLESILNMLTDILIVMNQKGELLAWSKAFEQQSSAATKPSISLPLASLLHEESAPALQSILKNTTPDSPQDEILKFTLSSSEAKSFLFSASHGAWDGEPAIFLLGRVCKG